MWGSMGNFWTHEAGSSSSANPMLYPSSSYLSVMHELHVLVVDHESDNLFTTARLLESCQYRVSVFELTTGAIQTLSSGKVRVDLILANINSPDLLGFKLLHQAAAVEIPVIVMTNDDNAFLALRAMEHGAYGYVKKPPPREVLMCLWQHVLREKIKKTSTKQRELQMIAGNYNAGLGGLMGNPSNSMLGRNTLGINDIVVDANKVKRKVCTEWTQNLHDKFMQAVETLGDGKCFPKEILELMDVPGLTRMQVASHLQKCRNDNWRSPKDRKSLSSTRQNANTEPADQHKPRRFGSMPKPSKPSVPKETNGGGEGAGEGTKTPASDETEVVNVENMEAEATPVAITGENDTPYYPQYEPMVPDADENPMNTSEDHIFNFMEMDCLLGLPVQLSEEMDAIASSGDAAAGSGFQFEPPYHQLDEENAAKVPGGENGENGSPWSSESTSGNDG